MQLEPEEENRPSASGPPGVAVVPRRPPPAMRFSEERRAQFGELVRAGEVTRVRRGIYVPINESTAIPALQREHDTLIQIRGVAERFTTDFVFSHTSAALLHGCWVWRLQPVVHVSQAASPTSGKRADPRVRRHHVDVPPDERTIVAGLATTSLERTVVDCASSLPPAQAMVIADSALLAGASREEILRIIDKRARSRGIRRARIVVDRAKSTSGSPGESILRWHIVELGLPEPSTQVMVETHRGPKWLDLGWPDVKVGLEFDGMVKYRDRDDLTAEKLRHDALVEAGWTIIRVTWDDLNDLTRLMTRIRRALAR